MEAVHNAKEWQMSQPAMQHSPPAPVQSHTQSLPSYSSVPTMSHSYAAFPHGAPMHPPLTQYSPMNSSFMSPVRPDSDMRSPGLMAISQPGTPQPSAGGKSPPSKKSRTYSTSSFPSSPYPSIIRKRSRNDSFFNAENGPSFTPVKSFDNLFAMDRATMLTVRVHSKMDKGFFLADNDWTCYRRNYLQISSAFSIHGLHHYYGESELQCLVRTEDGSFYPVNRFLLGIGARVSNSDKQIELVQHTAKRDKGPQLKPELKAIIPGGNLNMGTVGSNQSLVTFERIQFKTATANNGKRRAAQQYYVCLTELYADTDAGPVKVAAVQSAPLVVRGRSPGHYADTNERYSTSVAEQPSPQDQGFPGIVPGEYGSSYPYYPHFAQHPMMMGGPLTSTPPHHTSNQSHYPHPSHPSHPYMMNSESPSSERFHSDFHTHGMPPPGQQQHQHQQQQPSSGHGEDRLVSQHQSQGLNLHMPMDANGAPAAEWTRTRYSSSNSSIDSPAQDSHHGAYFSQSSGSTANNYSAPPTPMTPQTHHEKANVRG